MSCELPSATRGELCRGDDGVLGSFDHFGERFYWTPPPGLHFLRAALDVEAKEHPTAAGMGARFRLPADVFLRRWTASEAIAKVIDQPILGFLRTNGLAPAATNEWTLVGKGVWLCAVDHPTHWATVALEVSRSLGLQELDASSPGAILPPTTYLLDPSRNT